MTKLICPKCDSELNELPKFCPNCGSNLQFTAKERFNMTPLRFISLVLASLGLFFFGWTMQSKLSGKKPDKIFAASASSKSAASGHNTSQAHGTPPEEEENYNDPELDKIRELAKEKPLDVDIQKQLSGLLIQKIRSFETPPQSLVFETIDNLRNVLNLSPEDPEALIAMADISFDQQAFEKAIDFYQRYIKVNKDDLNARSRYASSLTFIGKHKEALAELESVLKIAPDNFHARAYSAIAYAQMGNLDEAKKFGQSALEVAPSPEAKERFSQFLKQLDMQSSSAKRDNTKPEEEKVADSSEVNPVVAYIKSNQIAGPKYRSFEYGEKGELILNFEDFPMQMMPPFAKDKFFNSIKNALKDEVKKPSRIIFKDISKPNEILDELILN